LGETATGLNASSLDPVVSTPPPETRAPGAGFDRWPATVGVWA